MTYYRYEYYRDKERGIIEMNRVKCYIYGAGMEYNKLISYMNAYNDKIEILGIVTTKRQKYDVLDGIACIRPNEMKVNTMDYIIIAVEKWKEVYLYLKQLGIGDEKILRSSIFYLPNFNLGEYLKLKKSNISILANSCLGGRIYKELGLKMLSPTINNICLKEGEYIDFLSDYNYYLGKDMVEYNDRNYKYISGSCNTERFMPKGIIDDKIMWYFPHVITAKEAVEKWNERRKRINYNNIVAIMIIQTDEEAEKFEQLSIKNKLGIYYKDLNLNSVVYCPEWEDKEQRALYRFNWYSYVHRYITNIEMPSRIDWIKFLNGEKDFLRY